MQKLIGFLALVVAACDTPGPPARLVVGNGGSDTVLIQGHRPVSLRLRAFDSAGRIVHDASIRYATDGALPVSSSGEISCVQKGEFTVRASVGDVVKSVIVRCQPVDRLLILGPIQFVLGDSVLDQSQPLPLEAYDRDGRPVTAIAGTIGILDSSIASLSGSTILPRQPGSTLAWANVGEREARIGVHVYQRVGDLLALDTVDRISPDRRLLAVRLRLPQGTLIRHALPPGMWMISMLPERQSEARGVQVRIEGASCTPVLTPRRFKCDARAPASVVLYRSSADADGSIADAVLLLRWMAGAGPSSAATGRPTKS